MWCGDSSSCVTFDSASEGLLDTLLSLLANHDGVGQGSQSLLKVGSQRAQINCLTTFLFFSFLQNAKKLALGKEDDALEDIGVSSKTPKAVVMWMQELQLML